ncbi:hemolysin III family protein [Komagataeibacter intermedius]|uniref:Hemolysin III n=2 Tax=Komagataeibacter intermedius TaxID=66229 RepID=A0A0N1N754_9PROT|nr:hemolysin III family protein [Komagataeibacter intermedius]KPH87811.1 hemolysin III [Komagataeibacter intermedius AF2]MCF3636024.1 hemolysin III family protein [Komagataeibacter intermedius]GAN85650.1 hemolysin III protein [Komagataeibacter intermedius TF2]GBQ70632.1 hemolysin III [Komagataeibacter intermedius NRIC 0521]
MNTRTRFPIYSLSERAADLLVHVTGVVGLGYGVLWLLHTAMLSHSGLESGVTLLYCGSILATCLSSAAYNFCPSCRLKGGLQRIDQSVIFIAIAASYTPFILLGGHGMGSVWFCALLWTMAGAGVVAKMCFFTWSRRYHVVPYLCVAWVFFLCPDPTVWALPARVFSLIMLGLVFYCTGVVFYMRENMPFSNALWHVMVVLGAGTHMAAVGSMLLYYSHGPMRGF